MAKASGKIPVDISHLPELVSGLVGKVNLMLWIGGAVIAGGGWVAYDLTTKVGMIQGAVGKPLTDRLDEIIKHLPNTAAVQPTPPPKEKQTLKTPSSTDYDGWMGVEAKSTDDLAKALINTPESKEPVWIYIPDKTTADALANALAKIE